MAGLEKSNEWYYKELLKLKRKIARKEISINDVITDDMVARYIEQNGPIETWPSQRNANDL